MCGIAGIVSEKSGLENNLIGMLHSQHHRGPDYTGHYFENGIYLGHNRLSIIDLSHDANQPFPSSDNRYHIVFNGEIYNYLELKEELSLFYTFKTKCDTEVLLASFIKWGTNCLNRLVGMFSFAIWDTQTKTLFAARDRFGVKPFHYSINPDHFIFSSEIKAIWSSGLVSKQMEESVWASYLAYGVYADVNNTFWKNIFQLPAGHFLTYHNHQLNIEKWYHFKENVNGLNIPDNQDLLSEMLEEKLLKSIKYRLHADVNVGFNLSGGIDSTLLFLLIQKQLDFKYTSAFTFYSNDNRYDELDWVNQIIGDTQLNWEKVLVNPLEIPTLAKFMQDKQDEPYSGIASLAYSRVFEAARNKNYIVLLDGGGMDEQIAGYDYYTNNSGSLVQGTNTSPVRINCIDSEFLSLAHKPSFPKPFNDEIKDLQYRDIFYTKLPRDLRFNDRMSMAYSTELREPFLDHHLVELSFALPLKYKIKGEQKKWILREIIRKYKNVPIVEAPKRPIQTPQREWLQHDLKDWVLDTIQTGFSKYSFLDKQQTQVELNKYFNGEIDNSFFIWQWITLGMI